MVNQNDMGQMTLVRGLQDLSKMSKNMFIASKLSKICIGEVGKFLGTFKSQLCLKHFIFANEPQIPSKAHFEEKDISYNSSSHSKSKKCSHKKLSISTF